MTFLVKCNEFQLTPSTEMFGVSSKMSGSNSILVALGRFLTAAWRVNVGPAGCHPQLFTCGGGCLPACLTQQKQWLRVCCLFHHGGSSSKLLLVLAAKDACISCTVDGCKRAFSGKTLCSVPAEAGVRAREALLGSGSDQASRWQMLFTSLLVNPAYMAFLTSSGLDAMDGMMPCVCTPPNLSPCPPSQRTVGRWYALEQHARCLMPDRTQVLPITMSTISILAGEVSRALAVPAPMAGSSWRCPSPAP